MPKKIRATNNLQLYAQILHHSPALIAVYNMQTGQYVFVSDSLKSILGYDKNVFLEKGLAFASSLVHPEDLPKITEENKKALTSDKKKPSLKTGKRKTFEYRMLHKNGSWRWIRSDGVIFDRDEKGDILHVMNISFDITAAKEAEIKDMQIKKQSDERQALLESISKLMMSSLSHHVTLEEIAQMLVPTIADYCRIALIDNNKEIKELAITHQDPQKVQLTKELYNQYIRNPQATYGVRKILLTGKSELMPIVDDRAFKTIKDEKLKKIVSSLNLQSYMGVPMKVRGKVIGAMTLSSLREDRRYNQNDLLFAEELARRIALLLDNARLYAEALAEIEKRKTVEATIRESENEYRKLIQISPMPIAIHSMGKLLYINDAAVRLIGGKNKEEFVGRNILDFVHPDYHELVKKRAAMIYKDKKPNTDIVEEKFLRVDGQPIYVEVASLLFHYEGKPAIQVLIRDITQKKQAAEELRQREERFRLLVQNSSDVINVFAADGTILYQSPSVKKVLGRDPEERIGVSIFEDDHIHPEDVRQRREMLRRTLARPKEMIRGEFRVRHNNGTWRTIEAICQNFINDPRIGGVIGNYRDITDRKLIEEIIESERRKGMAILASTNEGIYGTDAMGICTFINPALLQLLGFKERDCLGKSVHNLFHYKYIDDSPYPYEDCPVNLTLQTGEANRLIEDVLWTRTGNPIQVLLSCSPIFEEKKLVGSVVTAIDIRERKKLERQKDEFIGIASHELKTPVTSIKAYTQVLHNRFKKAGDVQSAGLLAKMDTQLDKLTNLIKDLLDVTKIETGKLQFKEDSFDFNALVIEITEEMQRTTEKHELVMKLGKTCTVLGDRDRIGQVLINFIGNAIKYSPDSKQVVITTTSYHRKATVSVEDFGIGIAKDNQSKVFERFFRGNEKEQESYPGLGLGLYISAEIIRRHKGKIWLTSEKGKGTTFSFSLPAK